MYIVNLKLLLRKYPECIYDGSVLKKRLLSAYPGIPKGMLNSLAVISSSGIAEEIKSEQRIGKLEISGWLSRIESDYCMSGNTVREALQLWIKELKNDIPELLLKRININAEEAVDFLEAELFGDLDFETTVTYCCYIIRHNEEHKGFAYYKLAKSLWEYCAEAENRFSEGLLSDEVEDNEFELEREMYFDDDSDVKKSIKKDFSITEDLSHIRKEIEAIKFVIGEDTNNFNLLSEKLLILSSGCGYSKATSALIKTYLGLHSEYGDYESDGLDLYEDQWFNIGEMNDEYDSFMSGTYYLVWYGEDYDYDKIDNKIKIKYAEKAKEIIAKRILKENGADIYCKEIETLITELKKKEIKSTFL